MWDESFFADYRAFIEDMISKGYAKQLKKPAPVGIYFFNWNSLHARLNNHNKAWSYKKKMHKKIREYREPL